MRLRRPLDLILAVLGSSTMFSKAEAELAAIDAERKLQTSDRPLLYFADAAGKAPLRLTPLPPPL